MQCYEDKRHGSPEGRNWKEGTGLCGDALRLHVQAVVRQRGEQGCADMVPEHDSGGCADKGCEVVDCGTPVLAMHSPYEVTSKYDVYMTYLAYKAFYKE